MKNPVKPLTPEQEAVQEVQTAHEGYVHRVLVAFDIFCNVIFRGLPDETISSHAARAALAGKFWGIALSRFLNLFQKNHGALAQAGDRARAKIVLSAEEKGRP